MILVCDGTTPLGEAGVSESTYLGVNEPCSPLGIKQATATAVLLKEFGVEHLMCSSMTRAQQSAQVIASVIGVDRVEVLPFLRERLGGADSMSMPFGAEIQRSFDGDAGAGAGAAELLSFMNDEPMSSVWQRAGQAWAAALNRIADGGTAVLVGPPTINSAMLCRCLSLAPEFVPRISLSHGSVSIVSFPDGALGGPGVIETLNYTRHLDEGWAVPIFKGEEAEEGQQAVASQLEGF